MRSTGSKLPFHEIPEFSEGSGNPKSARGVGACSVARRPVSVLRAGMNGASPYRMAVRIAVEEFLTPEIVPPIQFQRIWRTSATKTPERTLAVSVLRQAADDLLKYRLRRPTQSATAVHGRLRLGCLERSVLAIFVPQSLRCELLGNVPCGRSDHFRGAGRRIFRSGRIAACERPSDVARKPRVVATFFKR